MSLIGCLCLNRRMRMTRMADLFADALMLAIKIVIVTAYLSLLVYIGLFIVGLIEKMTDKARERKKKEVQKDDR